jgi:hypothetical protein
MKQLQSYDLSTQSDVTVLQREHCAMVVGLDRWLTESVQPAAKTVDVSLQCLSKAIQPLRGKPGKRALCA